MAGCLRARTQDLRGHVSQYQSWISGYGSRQHNAPALMSAMIDETPMRTRKFCVLGLCFIGMNVHRPLLAMLTIGCGGVHTSV